MFLPCPPYTTHYTRYTLLPYVVGAKVLDPCMRRSTEFPQWIKDHHDELKDKKVCVCVLV